MQKKNSGLQKVTFDGVQETAASLGIGKDGVGRGGEAAGVHGTEYKQPGHDHIGVINQMFAEFEMAYHNQFHKAYAQDNSVGMAKKYWLSCLAEYNPEVLLKATRKVVSRQEYLPSVASIIHACDEVMTIKGLSTAHDAYIEACCAPLPKAEYKWSHAVVYQAGKKTGWFELANKFESKIYPLFEYHYRLLCKQLYNGEDMSVDLPLALPDSSSSEMTAQEQKSRLAKLRKELNF